GETLLGFGADPAFRPLHRLLLVGHPPADLPRAREAGTGGAHPRPARRSTHPRAEEGVRGPGRGSGGTRALGRPTRGSQGRPGSPAPSAARRRGGGPGRPRRRTPPPSRPASRPPGGV